MLNKQYKAMPIQDIEDTIMNRILEIRDQMQKGKLSLDYAAIVARAPKLEHILADMDDDFRMLHRELENAKAEKETLRLQNMNGADAMIDVLDFQIESAESALETRLIELKADKKLMKRAQERLRQEDAWFQWTTERRKKAAQERSKMLQEEAELKALKRDIQRKKKSGSNFIYILMGLTALAWIKRQRTKIAKQMQQIERRNYEQRFLSSLG